MSTHRGLTASDVEDASMAPNSLYERLGGVFAIAAVVDRFSDAIIKDRVAGQGSNNPALREWHTKELDRLPGLKFMRTLWLCNVAGGPQEYLGTKPGHDRLSLEEAHRDLHIAPEEFDAVAGHLVAALKKGVEDNDGAAAGCFRPRHGIRVTRDGKTAEFVVCFECLYVQVYLDGKAEKQGLRTTSSPQNAFNGVLKDAKVPLPKK